MRRKIKKQFRKTAMKRCFISEVTQFNVVLTCWRLRPTVSWGSEGQKCSRLAGSDWEAEALTGFHCWCDVGVWSVLWRQRPPSIASLQAADWRDQSCYWPDGSHFSEEGGRSCPPVAARTGWRWWRRQGWVSVGVRSLCPEAFWSFGT